MQFRCIEILKKFLDKMDEEGKLPPNFVKDMIVEAAKLIMRWNIVTTIAIETGETMQSPEEIAKRTKLISN